MKSALYQLKDWYNGQGKQLSLVAVPHDPSAHLKAHNPDSWMRLTWPNGFTVFSESQALQEGYAVDLFSATPCCAAPLDVGLYVFCFGCGKSYSERSGDQWVGAPNRYDLETMNALPHREWLMRHLEDQVGVLQAEVDFHRIHRELLLTSLRLTLP